MNNRDRLNQLNTFEKITDIEKLSQPSKNYIADRLMASLDSDDRYPEIEDQSDNGPTNDIFVTGDLNTRHGLPESLPFTKGFRQYWYSRLLRHTPDEAKEYVLDHDKAHASSDEAEAEAKLKEALNYAANPEMFANFLADLDQDDSDQDDSIQNDSDQDDSIQNDSDPDDSIQNDSDPDDGMDFFDDSPGGVIDQETFKKAVNFRGNKMAFNRIPRIFYDSNEIRKEFRDSLFEKEGSMFFDDTGIVKHLISSHEEMITGLLTQLNGFNLHDINLAKLDKSEADKLHKNVVECLHRLLMTKSLRIDSHFNLFKTHHLSVLRLLFKTFDLETLDQHGDKIRNTLAEAYNVSKYNYIINQPIPDSLKDIDFEILSTIAVENPAPNSITDKISQLVGNPYQDYYLLREDNLQEFLHTFQLKLQEAHELPDDILDTNYIFSDPTWVNALTELSNTKVNYRDIYRTVPVDNDLERPLSIPEIIDQFTLNYMKNLGDPRYQKETIEAKMNVLTDMCMRASTEFSPEVLDTILTWIQ